MHSTRTWILCLVLFMKITYSLTLNIKKKKKTYLLKYNFEQVLINPCAEAEYLSNRALSDLTLSWRSLYHIETSPLICFGNQWTRYYMIEASIMKGLMGMEIRTTFLAIIAELFCYLWTSYYLSTVTRGGSRTAATSNVEFFVVINS